MIPDAFILEARAKVVRELPWPIPATVLLVVTDEDLDRLASAEDRDEYWHVLNGVVRRIESAYPNVPPPFERRLTNPTGSDETRGGKRMRGRKT